LFKETIHKDEIHEVIQKSKETFNETIIEEMIKKQMKQCIK